MSRLAESLKSSHSKDGRPLFVLSNKLMKQLAAVSGTEIGYVETPDFPGPPIVPKNKTVVGVKAGLVALFRRISRSSWLFPVLWCYKYLLFAVHLRLARSILRSIRPGALVVAGDRNGGFEPAMLREARAHGVVTIIAPTAFSASVDGLLIARRRDPGYCVTHNHKFKSRFPNQWRHDDLTGEDFSFFGCVTTYAYFAHKMLPNNPWVLGGGLSDWIIVESEYVRSRYIAQGVQSEKILVCGHIDHDEIAKTLQNKNAVRKFVTKKYGLYANRKTVILTLPNWAEVGFKDWDWHWKENEYLCQCATALNCNVLLSLHPSQDRARYAFLEISHPHLRIIDERLAEVLPASDIYLTGLGSSTVPWAVLSSIPTIIADYYPERDPIHTGLPGVLYVPEKAALPSEIDSLIEGEGYFQRMRLAQISSGVLYGRVDGGATERILTAFLTLQPQSIHLSA